MNDEPWSPDREYLGEILAAMAHDVRAPLGVVFGAARELEADALEGQSVYLGLIRRTVERLLNLSDVLSECGQSLHGHLELKATTFDLGEAVREAEELQTDLPRVAVRLRGPAVQVRLDRPRLVQALRHLIRWSAMKAESQVDVEWVGAPAPAIVLTDDGPLPREAVEPERTRSTSETSRFRVLIPVFLARQLVEAQGGRLDVRAQDGRCAVRLDLGVEMLAEDP